MKDGAITSDDTVYTNYDEETFTFESEWSTDARVCLQAASPSPCTVLGIVMGVSTSDRY